MLFAALPLAVSGCAVGHGHRPVPVAAQLACPAGAESWERTELYMGLSRPDGSTIGEADFQGFVDSEVTPRFPDGLTLFAGAGQWRGGDGKIVKEDSRVLVLLHPDTPGVDRELEAIRGAYIERFAQESVLRVDGASCVSF
jgi:hypothetical protein